MTAAVAISGTHPTRTAAQRQPTAATRTDQERRDDNERRGHDHNTLDWAEYAQRAPQRHTARQYERVNVCRDVCHAEREDRFTHARSLAIVVREARR